jgi:putative transposase
MDPGRTFFITTVTCKRIPIFRNEARARLLLDTIFDYREQGKYLLHAFVIMPNHIHVLLTPSPTIALERAMQFIKGRFSYRLGQQERIQVWQSGFTINGHYVRRGPAGAKNGALATWKSGALCAA